MKVYFNPIIKSYQNPRQQNKHESNKESSLDYSYKPFAYKDFNISFGGRLFRTPENFYEQDFNKNGMPKTLYNYIYDQKNYAFRKTIPPAQAMKEVFGAIADMQTLEEVKAAYPDEPLFQDLHSKSSKKSRTGLLGELALMRADAEYADKSLFKNGKDDLGMYILKKIYIEGKTLKEINKDFHRDKSVAYKGLSDIQYSDLKAFGIHIPKKDFWKSFVATREDFPYVYIPRKVEGVRNTSISKGNKNSENTAVYRPKNRFENIKDWEIDKLSGALIEGMGDQKETQKLLKKRNIKDSESLNFVAKYMGEINSVVLEKLHVSEEMKEFFDNYENLSKSQKQKFKDYWRSPETRELRSLVMSSTIRFFFDVYGVDGNNEEFQELLEYARGIRAKRQAQELEHNRIQAEYDEMFKNLDDVQAQSPEQKIAEAEKPLSYAEQLQKEAEKIKGKVYTFEVEDGVKVSIVANLSEMIAEKYAEEFKFLPKFFAQKYTNFVLKHPAVNEDYMLGLLYNADNLLDKGQPVSNRNLSDDQQKNVELNCKYVKQIKAQLMPVDEVDAITEKVYNDFADSNKKIVDIATQTLMELAYMLAKPESTKSTTVLTDYLLEKLDDEDINLSIVDLFKDDIDDIEDIICRGVLKNHNIAFMNPRQISNILHIIGFDKLKPEQTDFVSQTMAKYQQPLSNKEIRKITHQIVDNLINYDTENSSMLSAPYSFLYNAAQKNITKYPQIKSSLLKILEKSYVLPQNTTLRYFIDDNADKKLLEAKTEKLLVDIMQKDAHLLPLMSSIDMENMDKYIKPFDYSTYSTLLKYRGFAVAYFNMMLQK